MSISRVFRSVLCACVAAAVSAGCGGWQAPRLVPAAQAPVTQTPNAQGPQSPKGTLIYAVGDESSFVFTFPKGKRIHKIRTTAYSTCSDRNGHVFFTQVSAISEYEHGATEPFATFNAAGSVYSCSVDPVTHDLAVVVFCIHGCGQEVVIIPLHGGHRRRFHVASLTSLLYCAYDDSGNLFVDGYNGAQFGLAELKKGRRDFTSISLKTPINFGAAIQWDGEYLAVERREHPVIFRLAISGKAASIAGRTHLDYIGYRATQSWISDGTIAVPSASYNKRPMEIFLYDYPAGGKPTKILSGFIRGGTHAMVDGVTFSVPR